MSQLEAKIQNHFEQVEADALRRAIELRRLMGKHNWFTLHELKRKPQATLTESTVRILSEYGFIETKEISKKTHYRVNIDEQVRIAFYDQERADLLKQLSDLNRKAKAIENTKFRRMDALLEGNPAPVLTWYNNSPEFGTIECICSCCAEPIKEKIGIRVFHESEDKELRFHEKCYRHLTGIGTDSCIEDEVKEEPEVVLPDLNGSDTTKKSADASASKLTVTVTGENKDEIIPPAEVTAEPVIVKEKTEAPAEKKFEKPAFSFVCGEDYYIEGTREAGMPIITHGTVGEFSETDGKFHFGEWAFTKEELSLLHEFTRQEITKAKNI